MEEESSDYSRGVDGLSSPSHESRSSRHSGNPDSEISSSVNQEENEPPGRVDVDQVSQNSTSGSNSSRTSYARPDLSNLSTGSSSANIPIQNYPIARHIREGDVEGSVSGVDLQSLGGDCENSSIVSIVSSNDHTRDEDESDAGYDERDEVNYEKLDEVPQSSKNEKNPHAHHAQCRELQSGPRVLQGDNVPDSSLSNDLSYCLDLASDFSKCSVSLLDDIDDCCFMDDPMVAPSEFSSVTFYPEKINVEGGGELEHVGDGYFLDRENGRLHYQRVGNAIHDFGSDYCDHRGRFWTFNEFCVSNLRIEEHMLFSGFNFDIPDHQEWETVYQKGTVEFLNSLMQQMRNIYSHGFTESFWDGVVNDTRVRLFLKGNEVSTMKRSWPNENRETDDIITMKKLLLVLFVRRKLELRMREQFPKAILGNFDENGNKSDLMHSQPTILITGPYFEQVKLFLLSSDEEKRKLSFDCGEVMARVAKLLPQKTDAFLHRVDIIANGILSLFSLFKSSFSSVSISKGSRFELRGKFEGMFFLNILSLCQCEICKIEGLSELKSLEDLYLDYNQILKIEGLSELKNLKVLDLNNNQISKIEGLSELKNLETLYLYNNQISKIEGLIELKNLETLYLYNNQITKIEGLIGLKNLETLYLYNNQITKIEGLSELKNLEWLILFNNQISKIEGLSELKNLESLDLRRNPILFDKIPSGIKVDSNGEIRISRQSRELLSKYTEWRNLSTILKVKMEINIEEVVFFKV